MPPAAIRFYQEGSGEVPVLDWLAELLRRDPRAYAKCRVQIGRLADAGYLRSGAGMYSNKTLKDTPMPKQTTKRKPKDAVEILDRLAGDDPDLRAMIAEETLNAAVAQAIYDARTRAKLSQQQLAERAGTKQPVIARLEDADYEGHSLSLLKRIADALDLDLEVRFVPKRGNEIGWFSPSARQRTRRR